MDWGTGDNTNLSINLQIYSQHTFYSETAMLKKSETLHGHLMVTPWPILDPPFLIPSLGTTPVLSADRTLMTIFPDWYALHWESPWFSLTVGTPPPATGSFSTSTLFLQGEQERNSWHQESMTSCWVAGSLSQPGTSFNWLEVTETQVKLIKQEKGGG